MKFKIALVIFILTFAADVHQARSRSSLEALNLADIQKLIATTRPKPAFLADADFVLGEINRYRSNLMARAELRQILLRYQAYSPMINGQLSQYSVPLSLRVIPVIESRALNNVDAKDGGAGLWNVTPFTAGLFGLTIASRPGYPDFGDERLDPEKETRAMSFYLHTLNAAFGDWALTALAYRNGEGRIHLALKTDKKRDAASIEMKYFANDHYLGRLTSMMLITAHPEITGIEL